MTAPAGKRCPRCGLVKPADQFYRRRRSLRLSPYCKPCQRAAAREARNRRRRDPASAGLLRAVDPDPPAPPARPPRPDPGRR
jgi:hypothetical protein